MLNKRNCSHWIQKNDLLLGWITHLLRWHWCYCLHQQWKLEVRERSWNVRVQRKRALVDWALQLKIQTSAVNYSNFGWTAVFGGKGGEWLWLSCLLRLQFKTVRFVFLFLSQPSLFAKSTWKFYSSVEVRVRVALKVRTDRKMLSAHCLLIARSWSLCRRTWSTASLRSARTIRHPGTKVVFPMPWNYWIHIFWLCIQTNPRFRKLGRHYL